MNSRSSFSRRLAVAVMLTVLSTSAALAHVKNLSVLGSFDGYDIGVVQGGTLQASGGGAGNASHIGRFTYIVNATVNLADNTSSGVFLLVFNNGDVIHGPLTGLTRCMLVDQYCCTPVPGLRSQSLCEERQRSILLNDFKPERHSKKVRDIVFAAGRQSYQARLPTTA
jgi:hypothetical protein